MPAFPPDCLLVGGGARDVLRGREPKDFDWLARDPRSAALEVAARVGGSAFPLDETRGYWRVSVPGAQHDFVPWQGSVEEDLARRDFTVNAMAVRSDGTVIDPFGGRIDVRRRVLRMVSEENLIADPLRLLRAARLSVALGFRLEEVTEQAVRRLARASLPLPAGERIRDELNSLLGSALAARGVLLLEQLGLLELYVPELREGIGVEQGGFHHLDVFHHNVETLHQLLARFPDAPLVLRWAALLHDVGKPRCASREAVDGRTRFYGHDRVGSDMVRGILSRLRCPAADVERVAKLVRSHMVQLPVAEKEARRFVHRRRDLLPDLLWLMIADREAGRGPLSGERSRHAYRLSVSVILEVMEDVPSEPEPLLRGEDVMALLGVPPGPVVGAALRAVAEARAVGDISTSDDARQLVLSQFRT